MQLAIVIKDRRMQLLYQKLKEKAEVIAIRKSYDFIAAQKIAQQLDAVILPLNGVDSNGDVEVNGQRMPILELLKLGRRDLFVFTGVMTPVLLNQNWTLINLSNDEKIKRINAKLTAHGILDMLIMQTPRDFQSYRYDVLGYGACGEAISELLYTNHCDVRVVSRQKRIHAGCPFISYQQWYAEEPSCIIINTASACVIDETVIRRWKSSPLILDISTRGIGIAKEIQSRLNILNAPALPSLTGPETAAEILAEVIEKELSL